KGWRLNTSLASPPTTWSSGSSVALTRFGGQVELNHELRGPLSFRRDDPRLMRRAAGRSTEHGEAARCAPEQGEREQHSNPAVTQGFPCAEGAPAAPFF